MPGISNRSRHFIIFCAGNARKLYLGRSRLRGVGLCLRVVTASHLFSGSARPVRIKALIINVFGKVFTVDALDIILRPKKRGKVATEDTEDTEDFEDPAPSRIFEVHKG